MARAVPTGSGTGTSQTSARRVHISDETELRELRKLLARTDHKMVAGGMKCGELATNSLRWMDDGQRETTADVLRRRKQEETEAAKATGRQAWNSTPYMDESSISASTEQLPPDGGGYAERVFKPMQARKKAAKARGELFGAEARDAKALEVALAPPRQPAALKPKHAEMIEQMMAAYRREMGAPKTMRDPRSGRLREIQQGKMTLGRSVTASRSSRLHTDRTGAMHSTSSRGRAEPKLTPMQLAGKARAEAAKAEAAALATKPPPARPQDTA